MSSSPSSSSSRSSSDRRARRRRRTVRLVASACSLRVVPRWPTTRGYGDLVQFSRRCASPCLTRRFLNAFTRRVTFRTGQRPLLPPALRRGSSAAASPAPAAPRGGLSCNATRSARPRERQPMRTPSSSGRKFARIAPQSWQHCVSSPAAAARAARPGRRRHVGHVALEPAQRSRRSSSFQVSTSRR